MSWFRLEGRGAFHHKVLAAGNEAYGAWCRAGQWSSDQLTDGLVPRAVAEQIAKPKVWSKLVAANLIHEAEGGYQIHDFLDFNPSSEEERARREVTREKRREAGKLGGKRSGEVRRGEADSKQPASNGEANAKQSASGLLEANAKQNEAPNPNPNPIPNGEEDPPYPPQAGGAPAQAPLFAGEPVARRRRKRATAVEHSMPADWKPTDAHRAKAAARGLDIADQAERFRNWAEGRTSLSWNGRFANWLLDAKSGRAAASGPARPNPSQPAFAPLPDNAKPWTPEDE